MPGAFRPSIAPGLAQCAVTVAAVFQHDVGEESLIPADERAADQGRGEAHRPDPGPRRASEDKPPMPNPTAAMLTIGDEILSGRTRDATCRTSPRRWPHTGSRCARRGSVPDVASEIVAAVNALRARYDHVFTSGGIGPTHDDITADAVAAAFGVPIGVREDARAILAAQLRQSGGRPEPGAAAHGAHPGGRDADRQPGVAGAGLHASATCT